MDPTAPQARKAGEARRRLLHEHAALADRLVELDLLAGRLCEGDAAAAERVTAKLAEVDAELEAHVRSEEAHLLLLLGWPRDPTGPERASELREDHARQRARIGALGDQLAAERVAHEPEEAERAVRAFVRDLMRDMELEEQDVLSALPGDDDAADLPR